MRSLSGAAGAFAPSVPGTFPQEVRNSLVCVDEGIWKVWLSRSPAEREAATVGKSDVSQTLNMFSLGKLALARLRRFASGPPVPASRSVALVFLSPLNFFC